MTTTVYNKYRPYQYVGEGLINKLKGINWIYWLQRSPMALLSSAAAYGVFAFSSTLLPVFFSILAGIGIELVYLGAIALADQLYDEDKNTTYLWWSLNIAAVIISATINTLFASDNHFVNVNAESLVHAIPLPVLSFFYSLLLHRITNRNAARDYAIEKENQRKQEEQAQYEKEHPFVCVCNARFKGRSGLGKHKTTCIVHLKGGNN